MSGIDEEQLARDYISMELVLNQMEDEIKHLIDNNQKTKERLTFLGGALKRVQGKLKGDIFEEDQ